jgi:hypothetical protein
MATHAENHFKNKPCSSTVHIGHASTSNPSSGSAADEVLIGKYYTSLKPTVVLRPKTADIAEKSAAACEAGCSNNNIEYSQTQRSTLNKEAKKVNYKLADIKTTCYADCSSFMTVCALAAGAALTFSYMPTCGNMRKVFTDSGAYEALTSSKYLSSSDYLQRGDILVRENYISGSRHTVMVLDNGSKVPATNVGGAIGDAIEGVINGFINAINSIKITIDITKVSTTGVDIVIKLFKLENGVETLLTSSDAIKRYNWAYSLDLLEDSKDSPKSKSISVNSSTTKFSITNLSPNKSYSLKVSAVAKSGSATLDSPSVVFTTAAKEASSTAVARFGLNEPLNKVSKVYIKVNNSFKQAIIHNNI